MRALVRSEYGTPDVLALQEVDDPVPGDGEVLVEVHAAGVNPYDWHGLTGKPYLVRAQDGLRRPKQRILGADVSGRVAAVGGGVSGLRLGDEVFGSGRGAYAEYAVAAEKHLVAKPANVTFAQAAAVPIAGVSALQALRDKGGIAAGQQVLVNGASGGVGTFAVQIAKAFDAEVTGVCSGRNVDMVRSLGADHVVDYGNEDFTRLGRRFDLILDMVGNHPMRGFRRVLEPEGIYVSVGWEEKGNWIQPLVHLTKVVLGSLAGRPTMTFMMARITRDDLDALRRLMESGDLVPVVGRRFPLHAGAEALRAQGAGHAQGKTVITVIDDET